MKIVAKHRYARISAQKVRLVTRMVSGMSAEKALDKLKFSKNKSSQLVFDVLNSAVANAENNFGSDVDSLYVSKVFVDEGPTMKRFRARAKGRSSRIFKRTSHITVEVAELAEMEE